MAAAHGLVYICVDTNRDELVSNNATEWQKPPCAPSLGRLQRGAI